MSEGFTARRAAAYRKLDEAIAALHRVIIEEEAEAEGSVVPEVPVDAVLLIGAQFIDADGDRMGRTILCPRGGWQPPYITAGLLTMATASLTQACSE